MIRKLVLSLFIFSLALGSQDLFAKKKTHKNKKEEIVALAKIEEIKPEKKSRLKKHKDHKKNKSVVKTSKKDKSKKETSKKIKKVKSPKIKKEKQIKPKKVKKIKTIKNDGIPKHKKKKVESKPVKSQVSVKEEPKKKTRVKDKKSAFSKFFGGSKDSKEKIKQHAAKTEQQHQANRIDRMARRASWRAEQKERDREADYQRQLRKEKLIAEKDMRTKLRSKSLMQWKAMRLADLSQDYADGQYADLYKRPAWPFYMLFADEKNLLQINTSFEHATNWFNSVGSTQDLSAGTFGEQDFYWRDILLALDLNKRTVGANTVLTAVDTNYPWEHLAGGDGDDSALYNKKLIFFGSENKLSLDINYGRYIKDKDVFIGIEVPVAYKQTRLKFDTDVIPCNGENADTIDNIYLRTFQRELFDYVLRAKNLYYHEKTSTIGLGDISTLINFNVNTKYVEKLKWGGKIVWPTAKDADTKKLFAPELGKGFTQFKVFSSVMFNKQSKYFNPHMFMELTYVWEGHKNKRVPKVVTFDGVNPNPNTLEGVVALGDRVQYNAIAFSEPDSKIVAFADNVKSVKIRPGAEFNFRLGNIWEKLICRRAFLDVYYDFRGKIKDKILNSGLSESEWQVSRLEENTMQIEHKAGFDFSYQYDIHSRLNLGAQYTFAGINVPDTFKADLGIEVEF